MQVQVGIRGLSFMSDGLPGQPSYQVDSSLYQEEVNLTSPVTRLSGILGGGDSARQGELLDLHRQLLFSPSQPYLPLRCTARRKRFPPHDSLRLVPCSRRISSWLPWPFVLLGEVFTMHMTMCAVQWTFVVTQNQSTIQTLYIRYANDQWKVGHAVGMISGKLVTQ
jgi:hypothetical protein